HLLIVILPGYLLPAVRVENPALDLEVHEFPGRLVVGGDHGKQFIQRSLLEGPAEFFHLLFKGEGAGYYNHAQRTNPLRQARVLPQTDLVNVLQIRARNAAATTPSLGQSRWAHTRRTAFTARRAVS